VCVVDVFTRGELEEVVSQCILMEGDDVLIPGGDFHSVGCHRHLSCCYCKSRRYCYRGMFPAIYSVDKNNDISQN